jgi:hypothetical protein
MVGLLDLAPLGLPSEQVAVRGLQVDVFAIPSIDIARILKRFPVLRMAMAGKNVSPDELVETGADVVAAIIAAGTGDTDKAKSEEMAASLTPDEQGRLIEKIVTLTLPNVAGPLVAKVKGLLGNLLADTQEAESGAAETPATSSPS